MYINHVNIEVNPVDSIGMNNANYMIRMMTNLKSKFVQPGFEFKHEIVKPKSYYQPSFMHLKFCNGFERSYNIGISTMGAIQGEIKEINKHVEFERSVQGQDDELEDDEWATYKRLKKTKTSLLNTSNDYLLI